MFKPGDKVIYIKEPLPREAWEHAKGSVTIGAEYLVVEGADLKFITSFEPVYIIDYFGTRTMYPDNSFEHAHVVKFQKKLGDLLNE